MADANWKKRIGIDIKYSSSDEDVDERWLALFFQFFFFFFLRLELFNNDFRVIKTIEKKNNNKNDGVVVKWHCRRGFACYLIEVLLFPIFLQT